MQLPIVASHIPGNVDAVVDGLTGTLVPVHHVAALVAAIRRYLDEPALRRKHGFAGRERVRRNFQREIVWEATCREYVELLRAAGIDLPDQTRFPMPLSMPGRRAA
jgi:glycosyltransferase involved in cell wall biosynthesis